MVWARHPPLPACLPGSLLLPSYSIRNIKYSQAWELNRALAGVVDLYQNVLGRAPDPKGLADAFKLYGTDMSAEDRANFDLSAVVVVIAVKKGFALMGSAATGRGNNEPDG